MKNMYPVNHWIKTHGDLALDMVRIYLGIGLMIKAIYFMNHAEDLAQLLDNGSSLWFASAILVHYVILAHICGGFCLALGMFTRTAALVQIPALAAALFFVHLPKMVASVQARESVEFSGLVLFLLLLLSVYGAGRWSVDYAWGRKEHPELYVGDAPPKAA